MEKSRTLVLVATMRSPTIGSPDQTYLRARCAKLGRPRRATAPDFPACAASPKGTKELIWVHGQWSGDMMIDGVRGCPVVAGSADHEGLASPFRHELGPRWLWSSRLGEVGESADVVHVHLGPLLAELTAARPDPGDALRPGLGTRGGGSPRWGVISAPIAD